MPRAILFDLDETLTDRPESVVRYAQRFHCDFANCLAPTTTVSLIAEAVLAADVCGYHPAEQALRDFSQRLPWLTVPDVWRLQVHWDMCFPQSIVGRAGLATTLSALQAQGIRLGIITNGEVQFQTPKIEQLSIVRHLSTVVISEAVQMEKPDPRIFAHALATIGCCASETWFVGDHPVNDVLGASAAGLRAIWLAGVRPWPPSRPQAQWQITQLEQVVELVHSERGARQPVADTLPGKL